MAGTWQRLRWWGSKARDGNAPTAMVRLLGDPSRSPATMDEQRTVALLSHEGPLPLERLVDHLARDMYRDELRRGGWATEIGVLGSAPFRVEAAQAVAGAAGALWIIDRGHERA